MKQLKFKNAYCAVLYVACYASVCVIFSCAFGIIMTYFFENARDFTTVIVIGLLILLSVWLTATFLVLLSRTVVVTSEEIILRRGKKVKWIMKKEEIQECIYNEMKWYYFLIPISTINSFSLQFKLKEKKKISKEYCVLSSRQVKKIQETFNYPIRVIQTVYEQ